MAATLSELVKQIYNYNNNGVGNNSLLLSAAVVIQMNNDTQVSATVINYKMTSGKWGTKPGQLPSGGGSAKVEVRTRKNLHAAK